jgi:hypothetical protein
MWALPTFSRGLWRTPPAIHKVVSFDWPLHKALHRIREGCPLGTISSRTELYFWVRSASIDWLWDPWVYYKNFLNSESLCNAHHGTSRERSDDGPLLLQIGEGNRPAGHLPQATCPRPTASHGGAACGPHPQPSSLGWPAPVLSCPGPVASHISTAARAFSRPCEMIQGRTGHGVLLKWPYTV